MKPNLFKWLVLTYRSGLEFTFVLAEQQSSGETRVNDRLFVQNGGRSSCELYKKEKKNQISQRQDTCNVFVMHQQTFQDILKRKCFQRVGNTHIRLLLLLVQVDRAPAHVIVHIWIGASSSISIVLLLKVLHKSHHKAFIQINIAKRLSEFT